MWNVYLIVNFVQSAFKFVLKARTARLNPSCETNLVVSRTDFICFCSRFALSLPHLKRKANDSLYCRKAFRGA